MTITKVALRLNWIWMVSLKIQGKEIAFKVDIGTALMTSLQNCHELF